VASGVATSEVILESSYFYQNYDDDDTASCSGVSPDLTKFYMITHTRGKGDDGEYVLLTVDLTTTDTFTVTQLPSLGSDRYHTSCAYHRGMGEIIVVRECYECNEVHFDGIDVETGCARRIITTTTNEVGLNPFYLSNIDEEGRGYLTTSRWTNWTTVDLARSNQTFSDAVLSRSWLSDNVHDCSLSGFMNDYMFFGCDIYGREGRYFASVRHEDFLKGGLVQAIRSEGYMEQGYGGIEFALDNTTLIFHQSEINETFWSLTECSTSFPILQPPTCSPSYLLNGMELTSHLLAPSSPYDPRPPHSSPNCHPTPSSPAGPTPSPLGILLGLALVLILAAASVAWIRVRRQQGKPVACCTKQEEGFDLV
jgi:hypothetical protein